jgi:Fic family protein
MLIPRNRRKQFATFLDESALLDNVMILGDLHEVYLEEEATSITETMQQEALANVQALKGLLGLNLEALTVQDIKYIHTIQTASSYPKQAGVLRSQPVRPADYQGLAAPLPEKVSNLMENWVSRWNMGGEDPMEMCMEFMYISPFYNTNGRVGRLLYAADLLRRNEPVPRFLSYYHREGELYDFFQLSGRYQLALKAFHSIVFWRD